MTATQTEGLALTDRAVARLTEIAEREGVDPAEQFLRIVVVAGGCSGLTHDLGWDTALGDGDRVVQEEPFRVVLDRKSYLYLSGSTLDFSEGLEGRGFHFDNPQASRTCACGESFSL